MREFFILGIIAVLILGVLIVIFTSYIKSPPDKAYIISGLRKEPKILIGRAGLKIPFFERKDELLIKQISIDIKTEGFVPTSDFIGVDIDAVAKIRLQTDNEGIKLAMKNFLNMKEQMISDSLVDSLQGNLREIIGTITLKELCNDRKKFGDEVQQKAQEDMRRLGVEIISCNVQHVQDENNLINALGQDNMAQIQKSASIAKAEADKEVAVAKSRAEKEANDAEVAAQTEIAIKQNELAIKQAELKILEDTKQAEADAAYEIQQQMQRKTIEIESANANIAKQDKEVELKRKEAEVKEQALNADIRKQAEAEKFAKIQQAEAELYERQKKAEADKYEQERLAEAIKAKGIAEAEAISAKGKAEAEAIAARGMAEAEAMEKKAEAYAKYNNAAVTEMIINQLPAMCEAIAKPISAIDKVSIIDSGNGDGGVSSVGGYTPAVLAKVLESVRETTGFDLKDVMKANTYDAKVKKYIKIDGDIPVTYLPNSIETDKHESKLDDLSDIIE